MILGLVLNFKIFRLFYSRLHDSAKFNAIFEEDETFYRVTIFASLFSILFVSLPIVVASIFGFIYIEQWF